MTRKTLCAALLALFVPLANADTRPPTYTSGSAGISVTAVNGTVAFTNNHSGGDSAAFFATQIIVRSRAASANTCYLDYNDGTATTSDVPLAPGGEFRIIRGGNYHAASGWSSMGVICAGGQTATFDVIADRYGYVATDQAALGARVAILEDQTLDDRVGVIEARDETTVEIPPLLSASTELTEAQIRTLFSSPVTLIPAVASTFHGIERVVYSRAAGSAYTIGTCGSFQLLLNAVAYDSYACSLLLNGAGPYRRITTDVNGGSSPYGAFAVVSSTRDDTNKAVTAKHTTADVSGGTGTLTVTIYYRDWTVSN